MRALLLLLLLLIAPLLAGADESSEDGDGNGDADGADDETLDDAPKPEAEEAPPERKTTVGLAPSFAFNLDDGVGLGAWGDVRRDALPDEERRHLANVSLNLKIWIKIRQIGWQIEVGLSAFPDPDGAREVLVSASTFGRAQDWWFGLGMEAPRDLRFETEEGKVPFAWHRFGLFRGRLSGHVFQRVAGPLDVFVGGKFTHHVVQVYEDTLLAADGAGESGYRGGPTFSLDAGLRLDGRDNRVDPRRGVYVVALAQANFGPGDPWSRLVFDLRGFVPVPGEHVVFAAEVLVQAAFGDIPFFEQGVIAGWDLGERSFTGVLGLRAQDRGRLRGPLGALGHVEIRIRPPGFYLGKKKKGYLRLAPVAWMDLARVDLLGDLGGGLPVQPSFGGGLRFFINEVTSARLDIGSGPERVVDAEGERVQWTFGLYGNVGHAF